MSSWPSGESYLPHITNLNLSLNKGLSSDFFLHLGMFISQRKALRVLDISYTAFYEAKQRAFSYGLNRVGVNHLQLEVIRMRGFGFSKKEGTLEVLKCVSGLNKLNELDLSDMHLTSQSDVNVLEAYLMFPALGKLVCVRRLSFASCSFFFENSLDKSEYSFSEHYHSSLFLLTSSPSLITLDLSGALRLKSHAKHFLQ